MIVVMAATGSADGVRLTQAGLVLLGADVRRATDTLVAQYQTQDAVEVFSVDFPEVGADALRSASWRKTAEDCTRIALAMYLKHRQGHLNRAWNRKQRPSARFGGRRSRSNRHSQRRFIL